MFFKTLDIKRKHGTVRRTLGSGERHSYEYDVSSGDVTENLLMFLNEFAIDYTPVYCGFGLELYRHDNDIRSVQVFLDCRNKYVKLDILVHNIEEFHNCHETEKAS